MSVASFRIVFTNGIPPTNYNKSYALTFSENDRNTNDVQIWELMKSQFATSDLEPFQWKKEEGYQKWFKSGEYIISIVNSIAKAKSIKSSYPNLWAIFVFWWAFAFILLFFTILQLKFQRFEHVSWSDFLVIKTINELKCFLRRMSFNVFLKSTERRVSTHSSVNYFIRYRDIYEKLIFIL